MSFLHTIWQRGRATAGTYRYRSIAALVTPLALLTLIGGFAFQSLRQGQVQASNTLVALTNTRSPLIASSHLQGPANPQQRISLALGLRPPNQGSVDSYIQAISQPASVSYHHFLTSEQSTNNFSPDETTYSRLDQFLQ